MSKLFDLAIPAPARPKPRRERRREEELRAAPTAQAIWGCLLDHGADPLVLAALLRERVSPTERRCAYFDLVHQVGAPLADLVWDEAFCVREQMSRRAFPVGVREIAEAALGHAAGRHPRSHRRAGRPGRGTPGHAGFQHRLGSVRAR